MHETAYGNSLKKIQHANEKLIELREKIQKYDAELKMSSAEAEIAKLVRDLRRQPDDRLRRDRERHPAADRSESRQGARRRRPVAEGHRRDQGRRARCSGQLAEQALQEFEVELGLKSPETTPVSQAAKDLGPAPSSDRSRRTVGTRIRSRSRFDHRSTWQRTAETGVLRRSPARGRRPRRPRALALRRDRPGGGRPARSRTTS